MSLYNICKLFYKKATNFNDPEVSKDEIKKYLNNAKYNLNDHKHILEICKNSNINKEIVDFIIKNFRSDDNYNLYIEALEENLVTHMMILEDPSLLDFDTGKYKIDKMSIVISKVVNILKSNKDLEILRNDKDFLNPKVISTILNNDVDELIEDIKKIPNYDVYDVYDVYNKLIKIVLSNPIPKDIIKDVVDNRNSVINYRYDYYLEDFILNPSVKSNKELLINSSNIYFNDNLVKIINDSNFEYIYSILVSGDENLYIYTELVRNCYNKLSSNKNKNKIIDNIKEILTNHAIKFIDKLISKKDTLVKFSRHPEIFSKLFDKKIHEFKLDINNYVDKAISDNFNNFYMDVTQKNLLLYFVNNLIDKFRDKLHENNLYTNESKLELLESTLKTYMYA